MQHVLTDVAEQAAAQSGLVRRRSKLTGPRFVPLVFGWLADPDASLSALTRMAATLGVFVSPQALAFHSSSRGVSARFCTRQRAK